MLPLKAYLDGLPVVTKRAVIFLIAGWLGHYLLFLGIFFQRTGQIPTDLLVRHLILGGIIIYFMLKKKPWARWLAIMGNLMVIVYYFQWVVLYKLNQLEIGLMVIVSLTFAYSTVLLFHKDTSTFFKREKERIQAEFKNQGK